jgi:hypothetical protein
MLLSIKGSFVTFSILTLSTTALCHYADCRVLFIVMLMSFTLIFIMLSVVMLNVVMLCVVAPPLSVARRCHRQFWKKNRQFKNRQKLVPVFHFERKFFWKCWKFSSSCQSRKLIFSTKDDIFQSYLTITGFGTGRQKKKFNQKLVQW